MAIPVTVDNFARAESDRLFAALHAAGGGVNRLQHNRVPTPIAQQLVIRMNRDTLGPRRRRRPAEGVEGQFPEAGATG
jgi:hypothetical protein